MEFRIASRQDSTRQIDSAFRFGIEEEYFVCDAASLAPAMDTPDALFRDRRGGPGGPLNREMLQAQVEVATRPHASMRDARDELAALRRTAAEAAAEHGLVIMACGTHPTADWRNSVHSPKKRYAELMEGLQMVGRRNMVCGMHVHVEVPDPNARVDLMVRLTPYVPLMIALSTSSPFWRSQATGLKSYRLTAYDELPRTGIPELFRSAEDYDAYVSALVCSGAIPDASHVWWAVRPSEKYPTLELRATDACTRLDHAIAIAALYWCVVQYLFRHPRVHADLDAVDRAIIVENKWRAQRYGVTGSFVSPAGAVPVAEILEQAIEQVADQAVWSGCLDELLSCRAIVTSGTSADAQLRLVHLEGCCDDELRAVLAWIAETTTAV
jgi:glutamate---cysteine ligase / carboxylate-amine ligase